MWFSLIEVWDMVADQCLAAGEYSHLTTGCLIGVAASEKRASDHATGSARIYLPSIIVSSSFGNLCTLGNPFPRPLTFRIVTS